MSFSCVTELTDGQVRDLCALLETTWWARGRAEADVRRMLEHSVVAGLGREDRSREASLRADRRHKEGPEGLCPSPS
jgi:hypothetical protein